MKQISGYEGANSKISEQTHRDYLPQTHEQKTSESIGRSIVAMRAILRTQAAAARRDFVSCRWR